MQASRSLSKSYARANQELAQSFRRYLVSRGQSHHTVRAYGGTIRMWLESLGSTSAVEADRAEIREFLAELCDRGIDPRSIRRHTFALRSFYKFLTLAGLVRRDPTILVPHRKFGQKSPLVLTIKQVEQLIEAAKTPFERAVVEVLYSTGVRVDELCHIRLEDIDFMERVIRIRSGKDGKDRIVLYGTEAALAIREYLGSRQTGFLFEPPIARGHLRCIRRWRQLYWYASLYLDGKMRSLYLGRKADLTEADAQKKLNQFLSKPRPARPYDPCTIRAVVHRIGHRIGLGKVHPHAFRRAFATHMLEHGASIRAIQELLGHTSIAATAVYLNLGGDHVRRVHADCHPLGDSSGKKS